MSDFQNVIEINNLTKSYDGFTLDHIGFDVPKGSIMGFIGQNGAGKTTTIKLMLNLMKRDEGTIKMFGLDNVENETQVKEKIAVVFDELPFHDDLNAKQVGLILSDIFPSWQKNTYVDFLERFTLPMKKNRQLFKRYANEASNCRRSFSQSRASDHGRSNRRP